MSAPLSLPYLTTRQANDNIREPMFKQINQTTNGACDIRIPGRRDDFEFDPFCIYDPEIVSTRQLYDSAQRSKGDYFDLMRFGELLSLGRVILTGSFS